MKELKVKTSTNDYSVVLEEGLRFNVANYIHKNYSSIFVITDYTVAPLYLDDVIKSFKKQSISHDYYIIPSGEASKSMNMYETLQTKLLESQLDRKSLILALGGGVVGDLAGFVAATFMRGIDYIQMPTTILAHDSSVGGKVAINHPLGKNLIGSFYPPTAVLYDIQTLETLPKHEIRSGYAELVKEAYISNPHFLEQLFSVSLDDLNAEQLQSHLYQGIQIKRDIVQQDEKEANIRMFLNFGHTLAHAIETELGYGEMTHGEAVAIGMLFALKRSEKHTNEDLKYYELCKWLKNNEFPLFLGELRIDCLIKHMKKDKKTMNQHIQMVLLNRIGEPTVQTVTDEELLNDLHAFMKELNTK